MLQIVGNNLLFCKQILQVPFYTDLTTQIPLPRFLDDSTPQMIPITIFHNDCEKFTIIFPPIFGLRFGRHQFAHDDLWWLLPPNEVLRSRGCFGAPPGSSIIKLSHPHYILVQQGYTWKWVNFLILWDLQKSSPISDSPILHRGKNVHPKKMIDMNVIGRRKFA